MLRANLSTWIYFIYIYSVSQFKKFTKWLSLLALQMFEGPYIKLHIQEQQFVHLTWLHFEQEPFV